LSRARNIIYYWLTILLILGLCSALSVLTHRPNTTVVIRDIQLVNFRHVAKEIIQDGRLSSMTGDSAYMIFNVDIDLTDVFNWNVKYLFVWIKADYITSDRRVNQIVLWDGIIENRTVSKFPVSLPCDYLLFDHRSSLKGIQVNITVEWNIMPIIGVIKLGGPGQTSAKSSIFTSISSPSSNPPPLVSPDSTLPWVPPPIYSLTMPTKFR